MAYADPSDILGLKTPANIGTDRKAGQVVVTLVPPPLPAVYNEISNFTTAPVPPRYRVPRNTLY